MLCLGLQRRQNSCTLLSASRDPRFLVWGDFDVDGQTSTSLLVTALRALAGDDAVRFHVPNRFEESHGIKVRQAARPKLDAGQGANGRARCNRCSVHAIHGHRRRARQMRHATSDAVLTVVITDHHDHSSAELPGTRSGPGPAVGAVSDRRSCARTACAAPTPSSVLNEFLPSRRSAAYAAGREA